MKILFSSGFEITINDQILFNGRIHGNTIGQAIFRYMGDL